MFLRNSAKQEQIKSASGGLPGAFATWQAAGGRAPPATSPERWGRSWASRPSRCAVAARALTPIPPTVPLKPLRGPLARFSSGGRVKGLVRPAAPQGRGHGPLTRPERPKPAGRVSGRSSPGTPAPRREAPAGSPEGAYRRAVQGAPPAWGSKGRAAPLGLRSEQKPSAEGGIFCSSSFALRLFTAPQGA